MRRRILSLVLAGVIAAGPVMSAFPAHAIEGGTRDQALKEQGLKSDAERSREIQEQRERSERRDSDERRESGDRNERRDRDDARRERRDSGDRSERRDRDDARREWRERRDRDYRRDRRDYDSRRYYDRRDYDSRRYYDRRDYDSRRYYPRYRRYDNDLGDIAAGIAGAIALGIIANSAQISHDRSDWERCDARYRSFRWSDGTFQPYNGPRQLCPYLR